tara:strand:- start:1066 stop:2358 length:1293 start_codon:yes stop_codon:yes gene_type:complete
VENKTLVIIMLDIQLIRQKTSEIKASLNIRGSDYDIDKIINLDKQRRTLLQQTEQLKSKRNKTSKDIGNMKDNQSRVTLIDEMREVGNQISSLDNEVRKIESTLHKLMLEIPNIPHSDTPVGENDKDNVTIKEVGTKPSFDFIPKPHWEIGTNLGLIDFERGVKLSGSRFYVLNKGIARMQRALINFMLDLHTQQGYSECYLPFMVKEINFTAAGQLPKFADNIYRDIEDDAWFVTTAEVPLTNLHRDEIISSNDLPLFYTAYTPCFRREKFAAGKEVRGIKRGHQFDKVEMYALTTPDSSDEALNKLLIDAEETCKLLNLTYRVQRLCSGDLGFGSQITYDIEVWSPGCNEWLEVSSISNCGDFQARRANIRYRPKKNTKTEYVHTLNGSGLGIPRTLIAIIENNQQSDGRIQVPEALVPWMSNEEMIG